MKTPIGRLSACYSFRCMTKDQMAFDCCLPESLHKSPSTDRCRASAKQKKLAKAPVPVTAAAAATEVDQDAAAYERLPRKRLAEDKAKDKATASLPYKTPEGELLYTSSPSAALPKVQ